jgi:hypothetical protein
VTLYAYFLTDVKKASVKFDSTLPIYNISNNYRNHLLISSFSVPSGQDFEYIIVGNDSDEMKQGRYLYETYVRCIEGASLHRSRNEVSYSLGFLVVCVCGCCAYTP